MLCVPIWDSSESRGYGKQRSFNDAKVVGAVMLQNKVDEKDGSHVKFDNIDEIIVSIFADFVSVGVTGTQLQDRALYLSSEMHGQMKNMNNRIDELMSGKQTLMTAEEMLRSEEQGERERIDALKRLIEVSREMDAQSEVVDALMN